MDRQVMLFTVLGMFIDTIVLFFYLNCHCIKKGKHWRVLVAFSIYFLINFIMGGLEVRLGIRTFCNLCIIMGIQYFFYDKINYYEIGKEALVFILLLGVAELLVVPLIFLLTNNYDVSVFNDSSKPSLWLVSMILSRMLSLCLFMIYRKIQKRNYEKLDRQEIWILYLPLVISFISFLVIARIVLDFNNYEEDKLSVLLTIIAWALVSSTMIHMIFFEKYIHYRNRDRELSMLKQKNYMQYEYYRNQVETFEKMRVMYHDLKNHLLVSNHNPKYLRETKEALRQFDRFSDTGNDILNILLWEKYNEANKLGIELDTIIEKVDLNFIDDMDACSIVGNILDNAIEACSEVDRNQVPGISVRIGQINNFIVIKVENDCIGNTRKRQGNSIFETTKTEKKLHGIGLNSIKYVVEKYDGNCEFECSGNRFLTEVLIPITH